jgi:hypothetical protein
VPKCTSNLEKTWNVKCSQHEYDKYTIEG